MIYVWGKCLIVVVFLCSCSGNDPLQSIGQLSSDPRFAQLVGALTGQQNVQHMVRMNLLNLSNALTSIRQSIPLVYAPAQGNAIYQTVLNARNQVMNNYDRPMQTINAPTPDMVNLLINDFQSFLSGLSTEITTMPPALLKDLNQRVQTATTTLSSFGSNVAAVGQPFAMGGGMAPPPGSLPQAMPQAIPQAGMPPAAPAGMTGRPAY